MKKNLNNKDRGFVRLIIILIIVLLIAAFMGYTPNQVWDNAIFPVISFIWKAVVLFVNFLINILKDAGLSLTKIIKFFQGVLENN